MTVLLSTFAKWTRHAAMKNRVVVAFFGFFFSPHLAVFGAHWEGCELWGCTFVKVHSPERFRAIQGYCQEAFGEETDIIISIIIILFFCKHAHTYKCARPQISSKVQNTYIFFSIPLFHLHLLFRGLMCESFICLFDVLPFLTFTRAGWTVFDRWRKIILPWCFIVDMWIIDSVRASLSSA